MWQLIHLIENLIVQIWVSTKSWYHYSSSFVTWDFYSLFSLLSMSFPHTNPLSWLHWTSPGLACRRLEMVVCSPGGESVVMITELNLITVSASLYRGDNPCWSHTSQTIQTGQTGKTTEIILAASLCSSRYFLKDLVEIWCNYYINHLYSYCLYFYYISFTFTTIYHL